MPLTLLTLVQRSARRLVIKVPTQALTDADATQLVELARETGEDLLKRHEWAILRTRRTFAGAASVALTDDHDRFVGPAQGELWDESLDRPCRGPLDSYAWDLLQARQITAGTPPYWSLIGGVINIYPTPTQDFTYSYVKNNWVIPAAGGTRTTDFASDQDTTIFPDDCMRFGIRWKWREGKSLNYAEALSDYERAVERAISRDRGPRVVELSRRYEDVPDNYWPGEITV